jgi:hypothetical protein
VALAESEFFRSDTYVGHVSSFIFGVTTVLTVFYPNIGQVMPVNLEQAEAHLTCLKIVEPGASDSGPPGLLNSASSSFSIPRTWMVVVVALLFTVHFWL